jgi:hypothetical protein
LRGSRAVLTLTDREFIVLGSLAAKLLACRDNGLCRHSSLTPITPDNVSESKLILDLADNLIARMPRLVFDIL